MLSSRAASRNWRDIRARAGAADAVNQGPRTKNRRPKFLGICTACIGRNYHLQDIQLSKISPGDNALGHFRAPRAFSPETPFARSLAGPRCPAPFARVETLFERPAVVSGLSNLVENTGLEPVTSWLQTRRSPS